MSAQSLFAAVQANLFGHVSFVQQRVPGMLFQELSGGSSGVALVDSGLESDTFNKVLWGCDAHCGCREVDPAKGKDCFSEAIAHFGNRAFTIWAGACGHAAEPGRLCAALGMQATETETAMTLPLFSDGMQATPPEGVQILPVRTDAELEAFVSVMAANWTPPDLDVGRFYRAAAPFLGSESPMQLFAGFAAGKAVSCGELFLTEGGSVAGLHMICTLEACRCKGFGTAMTAALLTAGRKAGASRAVLLASADGEPVYRHLGFASCGHFTEYAFSFEIIV